MAAKLGTWVVAVASSGSFGGELLDSWLVSRGGETIARVTHVRAVTYTAWVGGKRDGGYRGPLEAQRGAERSLRKLVKEAK